MNQSLFLDTPVFFQCSETVSLGTVLEHAINAGYQIRTSISVLGEALSQMHEKENAMEYISRLNRVLDDWSIAIQFPGRSGTDTLLPDGRRRDRYPDDPRTY